MSMFDPPKVESLDIGTDRDVRRARNSAQRAKGMPSAGQSEKNFRESLYGWQLGARDPLSQSDVRSGGRAGRMEGTPPDVIQGAVPGPPGRV